MAENRIHLRSLLQRLKHIHFKSDTILTMDIATTYYASHVDDNVYLTIETPSGEKYCEDLNLGTLAKDRVFFPPDFVLPEGADEPIIDDDIKDERKYYIGWKREPRFQEWNAPGSWGSRNIYQYVLFLNIDSIYANLLARLRVRDNKAELRSILFKFKYNALYYANYHDTYTNLIVRIGYWRGKDIFPFIPGLNETAFTHMSLDVESIGDPVAGIIGECAVRAENDSTYVYSVVQEIQCELRWTENESGKLELTDMRGTPSANWKT